MVDSPGPLPIAAWVLATWLAGLPAVGLAQGSAHPSTATSVEGDAAVNPLAVSVCEGLAIDAVALWPMVRVEMAALGEVPSGGTHLSVRSRDCRRFPLRLMLTVGPLPFADASQDREPVNATREIDLSDAPPRHRMRTLALALADLWQGHRRAALPVAPGEGPTETEAAATEPNDQETAPQSPQEAGGLLGEVARTPSRAETPGRSDVSGGSLEHADHRETGTRGQPIASRTRRPLRGVFLGGAVAITDKAFFYGGALSFTAPVLHRGRSHLLLEGGLTFLTTTKDVALGGVSAFLPMAHVAVGAGWAASSRWTFGGRLVMEVGAGVTTGRTERTDVRTQTQTSMVFGLRLLGSIRVRLGRSALLRLGLGVGRSVSGVRVVVADERVLDWDSWYFPAEMALGWGF